MLGLTNQGFPFPTPIETPIIPVAVDPSRNEIQNKVSGIMVLQQEAYQGIAHNNRVSAHQTLIPVNKEDSTSKDSASTKKEKLFNGNMTNSEKYFYKPFLTSGSLDDKIDQAVGIKDLQIIKESYEYFEAKNFKPRLPKKLVIEPELCVKWKNSQNIIDVVKIKWWKKQEEENKILCCLNDRNYPIWIIPVDKEDKGFATTRRNIMSVVSSYFKQIGITYFPPYGSVQSEVNGKDYGIFAPRLLKDNKKRARDNDGEESSSAKRLRSEVQKDATHLLNPILQAPTPLLSNLIRHIPISIETSEVSETKNLQLAVLPETFIHPDGSIESYFLEKGIKEGTAVIESTDGTLVFEYVDGKKQGEATKHFKNGTVLVAYFRDNIKTGMATLNFANKSKLNFLFENNVIVETGYLTYKNGRDKILTNREVVELVKRYNF